ncbi:MAG: 3-deoxy-manno-octulosonate cytidylyltransferase [Tepidisphaeraceae bacterium]
MPATVVIPARLASTRFPEKIIASRTGRPLVQHVVDQVKLCKNVGEIIVAADDRKIADALRQYDTHVVMTDPDHPSGTDRIAEVAASRKDSLIVNVQGDEPEIEPEVIDTLIERVTRTGEPMGTAATVFPAGADPINPNLVKVVLSTEGRALYFSRSPIPFHRDSTEAREPPYYLHLGLYAYQCDFLLKYASWSPTPLERAEKLEQLRALEHGVPIGVVVVKRATHGVDTKEQYDAFVARYLSKQT